ncbi:glycosyl transferase [Dictyobacter sp. S3.2.2.5]|uniref:Glycosyl transferase n=1 Tax=Dictyobacter halimunensis TaxID=3026934 RepID=A0ABQ6FPC9_9CHLR|nr:glycosyl transferase [Dictyobacter sp. S3.2.2.5]
MNEWLAAKNILAVRMDNMGDLLMLGPALRAIKENSPQARLTLLASPAGTTAATLLPWVDDTITWRAMWQDIGDSVPFEPEREQQLIQLLRERHFDAAFIFTSFSQDPHTPGYVCYLAGIPLRVGDSKEFGGKTLSTELRDTPTELHQVERNLRLIEHVGLMVHDRRLVVFLTEEDHAQAADILRSLDIQSATPYIIVHPGASAHARRYPIQKFASVANMLVERGWPVLVTGNAREEDLLKEMQQSAPGAHYLVGQTSLGGYAALVEKAALVICNNSLPIHMADALNTPVVALFAGTDLEDQWRPRSTRARLLRRPTPCHPCHLFTCPIGQPCLDIPPEEVVAEGEAILG